MSFSASVSELVQHSTSPLVNAAPSWTRVELGSVAAILNGYPWKSACFNDQIGEPVIRIRDVTSGGTETRYRGEVVDGYWIENGDLLVGMDGDFNVRVWDGGRALLNQRVCRIASDKRLYLPELLAYVLPGYLKLIHDETHSITVKHLSSKTLAEIPLPLPPLPEQRRIVAKIDSLAGKSRRARDYLDHIPRLVEKYKQAVLAAAFRGDLSGTSTSASRHALGSLTSRITKGASPNWQGFEYQNEGVLFVRSQNVGWGKLLLQEKAFLPSAFNLKQRNSVIAEHDVLLNIVGASIGRTAVATKELVGANCNQAVAVIKLARPNYVDARYVNLWLQSDEAQNAITLGSVDVARANFSLGSVAELQPPWPDEAMRREIVRRIEVAFARIERLASEAISARKLIGRLDQAVLAKAFRGELVSQDPADEPASVLLARIREQRGKTEKAKRSRRPTA
jgi:type I restriction enzyme S subunit